MSISRITMTIAKDSVIAASQIVPLGAIVTAVLLRLKQNIDQAPQQPTIDRIISQELRNINFKLELPETELPWTKDPKLTWDTAKIKEVT